uniref:Ig-like domain-containing protein n=1 Tax=Gadus morhua TaxID=8049 RepID=A0A8C5F4M2_GADMO
MIILFYCSDPNDQRFVSQTVVQQPVSASAQLGDPVALQCSITSQRTEHSNQCQGEPSVYWFRSGPSHPAAIYMNGNRRGKISFSTFSILSSESSPNIYFFSVLMIILFQCSDPNDQRFVSQTVVQQPVSASAQLGDPVALQCSITSQRTDHSNQCQGEPSVYWFRSGSSQPAAIYMNGNRSGECQHSSGPPSAPQNYSDAGTYYCALAACGEAMFGNGTQLKITRPKLDQVTVVLGILLACCLVVIIILLLTRNKKQVCEHCKGLYLLKN